MLYLTLFFSSSFHNIFDFVTESILCALLLIEKPNSNLQDKCYLLKKP